MGDGAAAVAVTTRAFRVLIGVVMADDAGGGGEVVVVVCVVQMASVESNRNRARVGRMRKPRGDEDEWEESGASAVSGCNDSRLASGSEVGVRGGLPLGVSSQQVLVVVAAMAVVVLRRVRLTDVIILTRLSV